MSRQDTEVIVVCAFFLRSLLFKGGSWGCSKLCGKKGMFKIRGYIWIYILFFFLFFLWWLEGIFQDYHQQQFVSWLFELYFLYEKYHPFHFCQNVFCPKEDHVVAESLGGVLLVAVLNMRRIHQPLQKWTNVPWKVIMLKGNFIFQPSNVRGYVSSQEGIVTFAHWRSCATWAARILREGGSTTNNSALRAVWSLHLAAFTVITVFGTSCYGEPS